MRRFEMWWITSLILVALFLLWLLAEWGVWKAIQVYFAKVGEHEYPYETEDVRQGSSLGMVGFGESTPFEVQEDGTVVGIAAAYDYGVPFIGRDDNEQ